MSRYTAKNISGFILVLLLGAVFVFSAVTKFISIEPFEWTFMDMGLPGNIAFFLARFFIGFEFALAFLLIFALFLRRFTYPLTQAFLLVMTLYLAIILITKGNKGDCGCFGDALPMSPLQSILKNVVLIAWTYLLQRIYTPKPYRFAGIIAFLGSAAAFAVPFFFVPYSQKPTPVNLNPLYQYKADQPPVDVRKGKHLVAFMSLGCPHCRHAATIFKEMYREDKHLPILMILYGIKSDTTDFFKETGSSAVPHFIYEDGKSFREMAGPFVPNIFWVNNSVRERRLNYTQLSTELIKNWQH
jgi:thiol-disulfide isomerase/thioredoxin